MEMILGTVIGVFFIVSYIAGVRTGMKINKGEMPKIPNPIKEIKQEIKEAKAEKEQKANLNEMARIMHNIEVYDGTSKGQIPIKER